MKLSKLIIAVPLLLLGFMLSSCSEQASNPNQNNTTFADVVFVGGV